MRRQAYLMCDFVSMCREFTHRIREETVNLNILVVGNGFDLAHGLPTRYTDFMNFLEYIENLDLIEKGVVYRMYDGTVYYDPLDDQNERSHYFLRDSYISTINKLKITASDKLVSEIKDNISVNCWYQYFKRILTKKSHIGNNWIDFESEIRKVIEAIDLTNRDLYSCISLNNQASDFPECVDEFRLSFFNTKKVDLESMLLSKFIEESAKDLENLIQYLDYYLRFVSNMDIEKISPDIRDLEIDSVLSFNYTDTIRIYNKKRTVIESITTPDGSGGFKKTPESKKDNIQSHFIHGQIGCNPCNIVLGVNEYQEGTDKDINSNFNLFKKFVQRMLKNTGFRYKQWLNSAGFHNVYIFGHSLDVTDGDILVDLITHGHNINSNSVFEREGYTASTTIFYKDKQQQDQQIANLSKILGQDKLIEYVVSANPKIIFKQQQPMQPIQLKDIMD